MTARDGARERDELSELSDIAEREGISPALIALIGRVKFPVSGPRYIALPSEVDPPANATEVRREELAGANLVVWMTADMRGESTETDGAGEQPWRLGMLSVRLGLCSRLLAYASNRLRHRVVAGAPTITLAPVRLDIADAAMAHMLTRAIVDDASLSSASLSIAAEALDASTRISLNLLGASGYVDESSGQLARAIDLLGDFEHAGADRSSAYAN